MGSVKIVETYDNFSATGTAPSHVSHRVADEHLVDKAVVWYDVQV